MHTDFKRSEIYINAKKLYMHIDSCLDYNVPSALRDQALQDAMSVVLSVSEGAGCIAESEKRRFYLTARSKLNEVIACFNMIKGRVLIPPAKIALFNEIAESLSRTLTVCIKADRFVAV